MTDPDIDWGGTGAASAGSDRHAGTTVGEGRPQRRRFDGTNPVPSNARRETPEDPTAAFTLTSMGDLLAEVDEDADYLVEGLIQRASVNVLSAKPKVGKSTLARQLSLAVARAEDFLGRQCPQRGTVWYLAFEGRRRDIRAHFQQMGATAAEPLWVLVDQAPKDIVAAVRTQAIDERPDLIIVDTMQRFLKARSTDDYAEMTLLFDQVIGIAQKSGAAVLLVTHSSKADRSGLDAILGSTAIAGSVDTAILLTRSARYRTIATVQRTGEDLDETVLVLDESSGRLRLGGSRLIADQNVVVEQLYQALDAVGEPQTQCELFDRVEARRTLKLAALKVLLSGNYRNRQVFRTGAGTRSAPYRYELRGLDSSSVVPPRGGNHKSNDLPFERLSSNSAVDSGSHIPAHETASDPVERASSDGGHDDDAADY